MGQNTMLSSLNECTCPLAGYCERHKVNKTSHWHKLCKTRQDYRQAWDDNHGPGQIASPETRMAIECRQAETLRYMRGLWTEVHTKLNPTQEWFKDWEERVPNFGCGCRAWLKEYIKNYPPRYNDWFPWTVELHNAVNKKLLKRELTLVEAIAIWKSIDTFLIQPPITKFLAVTSLSPNRLERQTTVLNSWKLFGLSIATVNTEEEIDKIQSNYSQIDYWLPNNNHIMQPINDVLQVSTKLDTPILIINADIEIYGNQKELLQIIDKRSNLVGIRHNYESHPEEALQEIWGLDAFIVYPEQIKHLPTNNYRIGKPMWDYWLAWQLEQNGSTIEWIGDPFFFHKTHTLNWTEEECTKAHHDFAANFAHIDWNNWRRTHPYWKG